MHPKQINYSMKKKIFALIISVISSVGIASAQQLDTVTIRIKGMKCDECAHKVMDRLYERIPEGIEDMWFDFEKRIATIAYDRNKTSVDAIEAPLKGTRYNPTSYSKSDIITRGFGLRMQELTSDKDALKAVEALKGKTGIDSLAPHTNKQYLFIRYDANKTCKADIRKVLNSKGFTPTNYYSSPKVSYAYYKIKGLKDDDATRDRFLQIQGVEDFNINTKLGVVAITYFNDEITQKELDKQILK